MAIKLNTQFVKSINSDDIIDFYKERISNIFQSIQSRSASGIEMTGWLKWIFQDHSSWILEAKKLRDRWIKDEVKVVIVIGTGGSYLGSKAALDFINDDYKINNFEFIFIPSFSSRFCYSVLSKIQNKKFAILVVSKSGTTLESAVVFRIFREELLKRESEKYYQYIAVVTDKSKGILKKIALESKFTTFAIEDDIGGRYSTLTAVGLLPMVLSGIVVEEVLDGAKKCYEDVYHIDITKNSSALYAAYRSYLFVNKKNNIECCINYDPQMYFVLCKMQQLFAESEGKKGKGLFPVLLNFTPDLHSVGQLLQDGPKTFFETTLIVNNSKYNVDIKKSSFNDDDQLDWLVGKNLKNINLAAMQGTIEAHNMDNIDNIVIEINDWSAYSFGYLYFWLCLSAMFSAYLLNVNPFDQPGVEAYKKRMFSILKS